MARRNDNRTRAWCYASGEIEFGNHPPQGAIPIAVSADAKALRDLIESTCRHGYKTHEVNGRPTKIPGTENLLVPGVPEAPNQIAGGLALRRYCDWITQSAPINVTVL